MTNDEWRRRNSIQANSRRWYCWQLLRKILRRQWHIAQKYSNAIRLWARWFVAQLFILVFLFLPHSRWCRRCVRGLIDSKSCESTRAYFQSCFAFNWMLSSQWSVMWVTAWPCQLCRKLPTANDSINMKLPISHSLTSMQMRSVRIEWTKQKMEEVKTN